MYLLQELANMQNYSMSVFNYWGQYKTRTVQRPKMFYISIQTQGGPTATDSTPL